MCNSYLVILACYMCTLFFSIAVIAVWPVFLYGKSNIDIFGSPFTEGGTIGNQWSDTER